MNFCDECETCAHCLKRGCIPAQQPKERRRAAMVDFNINDYVAVRLTDAGRAHHKADFERRMSKAKLAFEYRPPVEDADGWSRWQLWALMEAFGSLCTLGCVPPFETNIRFQAPRSPA